MNCSEYREIITAIVDNESTPAEENKLAEHLKLCTSCREQLEFEKGFKKRIQRLSVTAKADGELKRVIQKLIMERTTSFSAEVKKGVRSLPFIGVAIAGLILVLLYIFSFPPFERGMTPLKILRIAVRTHQEISSGKRQPNLVSNNPSEIKKFLMNNRDINFHIDIPELSSKGYNLKGAMVFWLQNYPAVCLIYEKNGKLITAIMMNAQEIQREGWGRELVRKGTEVYISKQNHLNTVTWWMGDVICIAVSELPEEYVISFVSDAG